MDSMYYECKPLQWDTDFFGVKSARVNLNGIVDEKDQNKILEFCRGYDFVTISNVKNINENNQWIGKRTDAFLADMNIQFLKILTYKPSYQDDETYLANNFPRNEQIINIARRAYKYSRFFNDSKLPKEKAKDIYLHWTESAFKQNNKYFIFSERDGDIAGYVLFSIYEDSSVIELVAVDEKYQGQKVGKSLIYTMESFLVEQGITKIKVGTQLNNASAVQFYNAMGFKYMNCGSIYHLWK